MATTEIIGGAFSGFFDIAALIVIVAIVAVLVTHPATVDIVKGLGSAFSGAITAAKSG
jgi:hypothetical protein